MKFQISVDQTVANSTKTFQKYIKKTPKSLQIGSKHILTEKIRAVSLNVTNFPH